MVPRQYRNAILPAALVASLIGAKVLARDGSLSGTVAGPDGQRLPAAQLTLSSAAGGTSLTAQSGAHGTYRIAGLRAGLYRLLVDLPGFRTLDTELSLGPGEQRRLDAQLEMATLREELDVVAAGALETVTNADLRECPAPDLGQALDGQAGLWRTRRGFVGSDIVVRGFRGQDVALLVDGQPLCGACPNRMDPPTFHVDFSEVDHVEIARGPFDIKNGGGLGGAINVVTRRPAPGWTAEPSLSLGSFGSLNPALVATRGGRSFSALAGASWRRADPYRDGQGRRVTEGAGYRDEVMGDDAYRSGSAWVRLFHHTQENLLQLAYTRQEADSVLYPTLLMDAVSDDTDRVQLLWETSHTRSRAYFSSVTHAMNDARRTSATAAARGYSMATRAETRSLGARVEWVRRDLTLGLDAGHRYWDTQTELAGRSYLPQASLAGATSDTMGAFGLLAHDFTLAFSLAAGLRLDGHQTAVRSSNGNAELLHSYHGAVPLSRMDYLPSATFQATWQRSGLKVSLNLGHAFRAPDLNERYFALRRADSDWVGNPALVPSRNTGAELKARVERSRLRGSLSLYANRVADSITIVEELRPQRVAGDRDLKARTWTNVDATLAGAEGQATWLLSSRLSVEAEASWVRGAQESAPERGLRSSCLPEIPPARARLALRYDNGRRWVRLEGVASARQSRVNSDLHEEATAGYGVLSASLGTRMGRAALTLGCANLLGRSYSEHLSFQRDPFRTGLRQSEPGRALFANAVVRFGTRRPR
jgi:iron complex outermembrane recepter protein